jgi:hypothetical protein
MFLVNLVFGIPMLIPVFVVRSLGNAAATLVCTGATLLVGLFVGAIAQSFSAALWTLTYRELTGIGRTGEETGTSATFAPTQG